METIYLEVLKTYAWYLSWEQAGKCNDAFFQDQKQQQLFELDPRERALSTAVERDAHNSISGGYSSYYLQMLQTCWDLFRSECGTDD